MNFKKGECTATAAIITLVTDVQEFEDLAESAGYDVLYAIFQRRERSDPATYIGKGKFEVLKELLSRCPVDAILINGELRPTQHFNLENTLKIECIDRTGLVLNIFAGKARDRKARLQVERARLEYEIPFLKEWIHNARMGEHPGFLGGGEYQVDVYYEFIRKRMKKIDDELRTIGARQELRRRQRRRSGFFLASIAGYTNAGKSSLLNRLTGEEVIVESRMFSTLSSTTRKMKGVSKDILLTDTVGFLHDLPHFMIESFATTIEDIFLSDLILLVVDCSDDEATLRKKLETSAQIILPMKISNHLIIVLNKIDLMEDGIKERIRTVREVFPRTVTIPVSTVSDEGIEHLFDAIASSFKYDCRMDFTAPNTPQTSSLISLLYDIADIEEIVYGETVRVSVSFRRKDLERIRIRVGGTGGIVLLVEPNEFDGVSGQLN